LNWTGGTGPYTLSVLPGGQPGAAVLEDLGTQTGTSFSWLCKFPAGTSLFLRLRDNLGVLSETAGFIVQPGSSTTCDGAITTGGAGTSDAGSTAAPTGSGTGTAAPSGSKSASASASSTPAAGGAVAVGVKMVSAVVGASVVALGLAVVA